MFSSMQFASQRQSRLPEASQASTMSYDYKSFCNKPLGKQVQYSNEIKALGSATQLPGLVERAAHGFHHNLDTACAGVAACCSTTHMSLPLTVAAALTVLTTHSCSQHHHRSCCHQCCSCISCHAAAPLLLLRSRLQLPRPPPEAAGRTNCRPALITWAA